MAAPPLQNVPPLNWQTPIVNPNGTASDAFRRWWQNMFGNGQNNTDQVQALIDAQIQAGVGITVTPDGHLLSDPVIAAEVQPILNQISNTQGVVLFRGASEWEALAPGTAGQFLKTQGAGADPVWASGGGGGAAIFASARIDCSNPSVPVVQAANNVASIALTGTGLYRATFTTPLTAGDLLVAGFNGGGRWGSNSSRAVIVVGIERQTGHDLTSTYVDISTADPVSSGYFDCDGWFSFQLYSCV